MGLQSRVWLGCGGLVALLALGSGLGLMGAYNSLNSLGQAVDGQWGQVENVYQRRADLVPNLVATVKGAAAFEQGTFLAVAKARAAVGQIAPGGGAPGSPEAMASSTVRGVPSR